MKTHLPICVGFFITTACLAAPVQRIENFSTIRGKTYRDVSIVQVDPDGISFTHANGAGRVLFADLPSDTRSRLGYDPRKAEAFAKEQAEKRQKEREAAVRRQQEFAQQMAVAAEARQLAVFQQQLIAMMALLGYDVGYGYSYPVAVPAVGLGGGLTQTHLWPSVAPDIRGIPYLRDGRRGHSTLSGPLLEKAKINELKPRSAHEVRSFCNPAPGIRVMPLGSHGVILPTRLSRGVPALNASPIPNRPAAAVAPAPRMGGASIPAGGGRR